MIKGMPIVLIEKTQAGTDDFGAPIFTETETTIDDVLVGKPSAEDYEMYGKEISYVLGIPKGDSHVWDDTKVKFFGETFKTLAVEKGIEENVPLRWGINVKVARYEG